MAIAIMNPNVSVISSICVLIYQIGIVYGTGPLCMECQREAVPSSCDTVVQCGPHEKCLLRQYENERGMVLYQSGCVDSMQCANFATNRTAVRRSTKREVTLCFECCDDDYCNSGGCNAPGFSAIKGHPPVCFMCQDVKSPDECRHIDRCGTGEVCYIHNISPGHYQMGCKATQSCQSMHSHNSCTACCTSDFCNRQCHTSSGHHHQNHVTTVEPAHIVTTPTIGTTIQPLLRCFVCPESNDPNCHFHHICPQDHVCYSSIQSQPNNDHSYVFQCKHKAECPLDSKYTDWVVIGRRTQTDNEGYCCFSDDCNYLPPTVTRLHTTPITSSMPRITDVGPLLKNTTYGVNVGLHCSATGSPPPSIHWDVPLPLPSPSNYVRASMADLIIWRVTSENAGFYTCVATNENGIDSQTIKLTVA
ncbi:WAP, Kazal, immunoglobulin, Kunitz and NTR domain-containing protein 1-like [Pecten maximus]|uniref:WAP, Kazal, immunoglobulin, Kunitz and NTR domain-containing protein 1-like n=1 Tax=Pecten maximus TaxID=6579 RepID=UPI001458BA8E|nr:WAP, Kazal, immunoglobulin, Kunitz and NTR domain-containing protein 1-like [Pecten maximus]